MIRLLGLIAFLSVGYSIYEIVVSEREKESAFAVATGERGARSGNPGGQARRMRPLGEEERRPPPRRLPFLLRSDPKSSFLPDYNGVLLVNIWNDMSSTRRYGGLSHAMRWPSKK